MGILEITYIIGAIISLCCVLYDWIVIEKMNKQNDEEIGLAIGFITLCSWVGVLLYCFRFYYVFKERQ